MALMNYKEVNNYIDNSKQAPNMYHEYANMQTD